MRIATRIALPLLVAAALSLPACSAGYTTTSVGVGADLGSGVDIYGYDAATYGDWHANYRQWSPTVVYESNGHYYPNKVSNSRQVQVYKSQTGYFFPPRDQDWAKSDKRFNSKRMPNDADYSRAHSRP